MSIQKEPETADDLPEGCDAYLTDAAVVPCMGDSGLYKLVGILTLSKKSHQHLLGIQIETSAIMDRLPGSIFITRNTQYLCKLRHDNPGCVDEVPIRETRSGLAIETGGIPA